MSLLERIGSSPFVLRLLSDDRVMRVTNGVLDAKNRVAAARQLASQAFVVLRDGHALPTIDPALDGNDDDVVGSPKRTNGAAKTNGVNGHAHAAPTEVGEAEAPRAPKKETTPLGPQTTSEEDLAKSMAERASLSKVGGKDVFDKCFKF